MAWHHSTMMLGCAKQLIIGSEARHRLYEAAAIIHTQMLGEDKRAGARGRGEATFDAS